MCSVYIQCIYTVYIYIHSAYIYNIHTHHSKSLYGKESCFKLVAAGQGSNVSGMHI